VRRLGWSITAIGRPIAGEPATRQRRPGPLGPQPERWHCRTEGNVRPQVHSLRPDLHQFAKDGAASGVDAPVPPHQRGCRKNSLIESMGGSLASRRGFEPLLPP
jgi:hypothetical protein